MSYNILRKDNIRHPSIFPMICTIRSDVTIRTSGRAVGIEKMSVIERSSLRWGWIDPIKRRHYNHTTSAWCWTGELEQSAFASWWFGNLWLNDHDHVGQVNLLSHKFPNVGKLVTQWSWTCWTCEFVESQVSKCSRCKDWLWQCLHFDGRWWWRGGRIELHMSPLSKCSRRLCEQYHFLFVGGKGRGGWSQNNHNTPAICNRKYPAGFSTTKPMVLVQ